MDLVVFLSGTPVALIICAAVLGLLVGSFLNVVVYRLPVMLEREWKSQAREVLELPAEEPRERFNLLVPDSRCPKCGHKIRAWENIPVISYLILGCRCAGCRTPISPRYPLVELTSGLLSGFLAWHFGLGWELAGMLVLTWGLLAMSLIDADHQILPDAIVLPLLWLGLILNQWSLFATPGDALWGAIIGYLSLWSVYWLFKLLTGKEGMGYGDFKLLAMLGAWGGWQVLPMTILFSSVVGAVLGIIILRLSRSDSGTTLPFGPYLAIAGWIALIWGEQISSAYLQFASVG